MKYLVALILYLFSLFSPALTALNPAKVEAGNYSFKADAISATHEDSTQKLQRFTVETALANGVNPYVAVYIITNESHWQPNAVGDHGLAHNVAQFHLKTFNWMKKKADMSDLSYTSAEAQITLMTWALAHNEGSNWSTFRRLESLK